MITKYMWVELRVCLYSVITISRPSAGTLGIELRTWEGPSCPQSYLDSERLYHSTLEANPVGKKVTNLHIHFLRRV